MHSAAFRVKIVFGHAKPSSGRSPDSFGIRVTTSVARNRSGYSEVWACFFTHRQQLGDLRLPSH